jgi:uncharacterized protein
METRHVLWLVAGLVTVALFAGVGAPTPAGGVDAKSGTVAVNGTASVDAVPDVATFAFGVTTEASTAAAALAQNSDAATKVVAALKRARIASEDLQTQSVSLSPRYSDRGDEVVGYTASNTVSAILRTPASAGDVIDAAVAAGANLVSGPSLSRADTDALYRAALKDAVAAARAKAEALGEAGQFSVGKIDSIAEGSTDAVPMADRAAALVSPIEPGTQQITATVRVTFQIA